MTLDGKRIVILGGSSGIGLATAKAAQAEGARIVITGRSADRLKRARAELGGDAQEVRLDVVDERGTRRFFSEIEPFDHLFMTAGTLVSDPQLTSEVVALRPAMDTRFLGALYAVKYGASKIASDGSITFMSGTSGRKPLPGISIASASCGAIEAFARALAVDLAPIRVNAITPGLVDTPLLEEFLGERREAILKAAAESLPVKRVGTAEDVAEAVLFLMKNRYVTGISLVIDGGGLLV